MKSKSLLTAAAAAVLGGLVALPSAGATGFVPTTLTTPATGTSIGAPARNTQFFCPRTVEGYTFPTVLTNASTPWVSGTTINIADINATVPGAVKMKHVFSIRKTSTTRYLKGNGIPSHAIGQFPIPSTSAAYSYYAALPAGDPYANAAEIPVKPYDMSLTVPRNPKVQAKPSCILSLVIGVSSQTGAAWHAEIAPGVGPGGQVNLYNPNAALPTDRCWGHPFSTQYHYHGFSWKCFPNQGKKGEPSPLFGYAADGFGIYGPYSEGPRGHAMAGATQRPITNAQLDVCHGHYGWIKWDGKLRYMYHYHTNNEYPYTIGCLRGKVGKMSMVMMHLGH